MKELVCVFCRKALTDNTCFELEGKNMCCDCYSSYTAECDDCGRRIFVSDNHGNRNITLCWGCYTDNYHHCEECGVLLHNDDVYYEDDSSDIPYCRSCYERIFDGAIKNYGYKPDPIFYGKNDLFLGVELEVDIGGEENDHAERITYPANRTEERMYCKHDGSIESGFEMVTHPMTLNYHKKEMPWTKIMDKAIEYGYRSHQTSTCGLHVHVGRKELGETYEIQEDVISRIVYFIEAHWNELLKFSRRTETNINRWASRYGLSNTTKETYDKAKKGNGMGRYVCLNLYNPFTIEFRIFRGTLKHSTFIATLELVHEICTQAMNTFDSSWEKMCWSEFVSKIDKDKKPALIQYLKSKQLYINELNESEEDL